MTDTRCHVPSIKASLNLDVELFLLSVQILPLSYGLSDSPTAALLKLTARIVTVPASHYD
jgi:hypothetical protein